MRRTKLAKQYFYIFLFILLCIWFFYLLTSYLRGEEHSFFLGVKTRRIEVQDIALFAATSAAAGWITNALFSKANSVKQHTMTVLTQARLSTEMNNRVRSLFKKFQVGQVITKVDIASGRNEDWYNAAVYMLNYYEFLAVALRYGDLHEPLLRDCIRTQFFIYCRMLSTLIDQAREDDPRVTMGKIQKEKSRVFQEIINLQERWQ